MLLGARQTLLNDFKTIQSIRLGHNLSYLNTGIYLNNLTTLQIKIKFKPEDLENANTRNSNIWSTYNTSPWFSFEIHNISPHNIYFNLGSTAFCGSAASFVLNNKIYELIVNINDDTKQWSVSNDCNISGTYSGSIISNSYPLQIGTRNRSNNTKCPMSLFYLEILKNNITVSKFIPILDEDSNPCFYNPITKQNFYSASSYPFEIGDKN